MEAHPRDCWWAGQAGGRAAKPTETVRAAGTRGSGACSLTRLPPLPSGVPASALGFAEGPGWIRLPAGLVAPEGLEAEAIAASLPPGTPVPGWWSGDAERRDVHLALVMGAVSLNSQVLPLLEAAERARAHGLVVLAPAVTHEALATILVNDAARALPNGILPLQLLVPEYHVEEVVAALATALDTPPWDGRPASLRLTLLARATATPAQATVHRLPSGFANRLLRALGR